MGQRHQTYIIIKDTRHNRVENYFCILHNQWNYPEIQLPKVLRFLKALREWHKNKGYAWAHELIELYKYTASVTPGCLSHHTDITEEVVNGLFNEDNNNGWLLIYLELFQSKDKEQPFDYNIAIGFKPGSEDCQNYKDYDFMHFDDYMDLVYEKKYTGYVHESEFNEEEKELLYKIILAGSPKMLKPAIEELYKISEEYKEKLSKKTPVGIGG